MADAQRPKAIEEVVEDVMSEEKPFPKVQDTKEWNGTTSEPAEQTENPDPEPEPEETPWERRKRLYEENRNK